jgi:hypothetical protein
MNNEVGQPLGYCDVCDRVRWIAVITEEVGSDVGDHTLVHGICRTCERENNKFEEMIDWKRDGVDE